MLQLAGRRAFYLVAVAFGLGVVFSIWLVGRRGEALGLAEQLSLVFTASTVLNVVLALAVSWGWRRLWWCFPRLNEFFFPDLEGTWEVDIHWQWDDRQGDVRAQAEIRQTLLRLSISLESPRSVSRTLSVVPKRDPESGLPELHYLYSAEPTQGYEDDNPPHKGAAILRLGLQGRDVLKVNYFTDRASRGHFEMRRA